VLNEDALGDVDQIILRHDGLVDAVQLDGISDGLSLVLHCEDR
jgi:hypothetical protein